MSGVVAPHHHSLGAAFMFWEKAERRAWWCWGRMAEGTGVAGDWVEVGGGARKFGGWKERGLKGNW